NGWILELSEELRPPHRPVGAGRHPVATRLDPLERWRPEADRLPDAVPYTEVAAWGAIIFELVGGVLLIVGALTRLVGLGVLIEQILIIAYTNWYKWPPTLLNADGTYRG